MTENNKSTQLFSAPDGKSYLTPFILVSALFFLWGFCNGMIDVMDKHFQKELHLTLAQSAWVQFAHYLGYFLMAMPAGWLASKFGYKGGILVGLGLVALGGFWFIPATKIATFPAFLLGVCLIAAGLTFLETIANPYSTVLGPKRFAATRINLSQSCNGIGWIFGPIVGAAFFYGKDDAGQSTGSETLWIPYAAVGAFVLVLAVVFAFARLPDVKPEEDFDGQPDETASGPASRRLAMTLLWVNVAVLAAALAMIISAIVAIPAVGQRVGLTDNEAFACASAVFLALGSAAFLAKKAQVRPDSIWARPHFTGATLAQFLYVAAQSGIFAYFINYMTSQIPPVPQAWSSGFLSAWFEVHSNGALGLSDKGASNLAAVGFACFLAGRVLGAMLLKRFPAHAILAIFSAAAALCSLLVFCRLGWVSPVALFLTYFFMSIMFPTIFSLGIQGLGAKTKQAASFIVMAIMGGAIMPKFMGHIGDAHGMSAAFVVPLVCFLLIGVYAVCWRKLK